MIARNAKRAIVALAGRGLLPAPAATWLLRVFGLRHV